MGLNQGSYPELNSPQSCPEITQFMTSGRSGTSQIFVWTKRDLKGKRTC